MKHTFCRRLWTFAPGLLPVMALAAGDLIQVHQDFSKDPGWEWKHNRIMAENPPTIKQDFGWSPTNHTGSPEAGEIGGRIWRSKTPAYYAIPLNRPLSFNDAFSFSGRLVFMPPVGDVGKASPGGRGAAYLGFFNHELQGWRVWNSMAMRLDANRMSDPAIGVDTMSALWRGQGGSEGYNTVPADGKPHTFRFSYDPDAKAGPWPDPSDPLLAKYVNGKRRTVDEILETARQHEPNLTREQLWERLLMAHSKGLITYLNRRGDDELMELTFWSGEYWFRKDTSKRQGGMTIQIDDRRPFTYFIHRSGHDEPVYMDRFGLFNYQLYHQYMDLYVGDLTINGNKIDLSKDPAWEGRGNRVKFAEQDFQRQNYGFSETNWAGDGIGEVGGQFSSVEPVDPLFGYYADDIGQLTLDDPISFSGNVCFVAESTDAGMFIGYFNKKDLLSDLTDRAAKSRKAIMNSLGVMVEGSAHGGKHFCPEVNSSKDSFGSKKGLPCPPTKKRHAFTVVYDPDANNKLGRLTATLDGKTTVLNLTEQQRAEGAVFDRFGVTNLRAGGKFVETYYDDLTYTVRRPKGAQSVFHEQKVVKVPYPRNGRKY